MEKCKCDILGDFQTLCLKVEEEEAEDGVVEDKKACHWLSNSRMAPKDFWRKQGFQDMV